MHFFRRVMVVKIFCDYLINETVASLMQQSYVLN